MNQGAGEGNQGAGETDSLRMVKGLVKGMRE